jgi:dTDP-4-amino-4,6-dideoxygalactose transaminase
MIKVPLLDLQAQYATLREPLRAAVERVMESQQFVLGPDVKALEEEIAQYSRVTHAIATPYSFFATAGSIARLGARPVFVDIEPRTYNLDPALVEDAITERTRAIMPVHLFGQCAEMDALIDIGERRAIPLVEDAAQAIGAEDAGRRAGAMSAVGCFSFYPTKNLGGAGDGGMMVTNDDALAERLRILRVHGGATKYHHSVVGINSRLDTLQAAVLRVKLPYLDQWSEARARNAARYETLFTDAGLAERVTLPTVRANARHIYNQYVIRVGDGRDALMEHLKQEGVGTDVYYPVPLHMQECFRYLGYTEGDNPQSELAARETLALPVYPELSAEQQEYVVASISRFFEIR